MFVSITATGVFKWRQTGFNGICNVNNGEVKLDAQVVGFEACQQACIANSKCQSISYNKDQGCTLYSTPCTSTKFSPYTESFTLKRTAANTTPAPTPAPTTAPAPTPASTLHGAPCPDLFRYSVKPLCVCPRTFAHVNTCLYQCPPQQALRGGKPVSMAFATLITAR